MRFVDRLAPRTSIVSSAAPLARERSCAERGLCPPSDAHAADVVALQTERGLSPLPRRLASALHLRMRLAVGCMEKVTRAADGMVLWHLVQDWRPVPVGEVAPAPQPCQQCLTVQQCCVPEAGTRRALGHYAVRGSCSSALGKRFMEWVPCPGRASGAVRECRPSFHLLPASDPGGLRGGQLPSRGR